MNYFRCVCCGKFISYESLEKGQVDNGTDYAWDGEPISEWYAHKKCNETERTA